MLTQAGVKLCSNLYLPMQDRRQLKLHWIVREDIDVGVQIGKIEALIETNKEVAA